MISHAAANLSEFSCDSEAGHARTRAGLAVSGTISTFDLSSVIHRYHVCKDVWIAVIGEERNCECERGNRYDPFAVAIMKDSQIVEHILRTISCICTLFIRRGGSILATVTGA